MDTIIDNSNEQENITQYFQGDDLLTPLSRRRGLPIGNLTSQFFANIYLNSLDHYVKETLKVQKYIRYVDDFALFSNDPDFLASLRPRIEGYLAGFRLTVHPIKSQQFETCHGATFLGFRVFSDRIKVRAVNLRRARRRLTRMQYEYRHGVLDLTQVTQSLQSWFAHLAQGNTRCLTQKILRTLRFQRQ